MLGAEDEERTVWSWREDSGRWTSFSEVVCKALDGAHAAGDPTHVITSAGRRYRIEFKQMRQVDLETQGSRPVRRRVESGGPWTCAACSYHNSDPGATACSICEQPRT